LKVVYFPFPDSFEQDRWRMGDIQPGTGCWNGSNLQMGYVAEAATREWVAPEKTIRT
jgi:hypothetical protein